MSASIRGSTLIETLVTMLASGIVLLSVMEGLLLFTRAQTRCVATLQKNRCQREGFARIARLAADADSIRHRADALEIFRRGRRSMLLYSDSVVIFRSDSFRDTLLRNVARPQLTRYEGAADTLRITTATGFIARFPVRQSESERYEDAIRKIEAGHGYESL